ncbi:MAG: hypothetical protein QG567_2096 [Campylobacterota bacterium]|nr:hypothetical protein [Campylobacterota bacterium]
MLTKNNKQNSDNYKIKTLLTLMQKLESGEELFSSDKLLQSELDLPEITLRRYLRELETIFDGRINKVKKHKKDSIRQVTVYYLTDPQVILKKLFDSNSAYDWIVPQILQSDPQTIESISSEYKKEIQTGFGKQNSPYIFVNYPFELFEGDKKDIFMDLKNAVQNREYRKIQSKLKDKIEEIDNAKCLKIVFSDNNWYLAIETEEKEFRLLRISFIESSMKTFDKNSYQRSVLDKYKDYFLNMQNALTLYNVEIKTAHLKIDIEKASLYFSENRKKFFPSQKFIKKNEDGSIEISISYTRSLEILPFIKKWIPFIQILAPEDLAVEYKKDLALAIQK